MDPLSAIASTIAVVQAISSVYTTIRTIKNLPGEFSEVARNLPLVTSTLDAARVRIELDGLDSAATAAIVPVITNCEEKATALRDIFQEIENKTRGGRDSSSLMLYRSTVLRLGKASRVEALMQSILKSLQGLAMKQIFLASGQIQVAALQDAVHRLADVPSSVPDSVSNGLESVDQHILQGGTGNQFINKGQTKTSILAPVSKRVEVLSTMVWNLGGRPRTFGS
ncbi:hypothetical protein CMQ_2367 [Grosmannia clavigera kw1407]|uniref:NACHT-NTPase and P-loop NTPases N-terminal domain-containing protein n=1 Tax=Grosmannia clavigera (strain kw1407 / UAMH 11150) TaxID=655863 RepID=F0XJI7_GROCL|nr:uncharacterized protein CMQ_2367 [Grosmannia clavigera kw1407]EFX02318.1 hypothetical protein CMQ_2367 [Grosmannia clavigera kw1407]